MQPYSSLILTAMIASTGTMTVYGNEATMSLPQSHFSPKLTVMIGASVGQLFDTFAEELVGTIVTGDLRGVRSSMQYSFVTGVRYSLAEVVAVGLDGGIASVEIERAESKYCNGADGVQYSAIKDRGNSAFITPMISLFTSSQATFSAELFAGFTVSSTTLSRIDHSTYATTSITPDLGAALLVQPQGSLRMRFAAGYMYGAMSFSTGVGVAL